MRGLKVFLDRDLAELYGVETRAIIQAVKRNRRRFPDDFMFQLTRMEAEYLASEGYIGGVLRSQIVTLNKKMAKDEGKKVNLKSQIVTSSLRSQFVISNRGGRRYLPYVFTEQGVAMLSSVLRSKRAIEIHPVKSLRDAQHISRGKYYNYASVYKNKKFDLFV